MSKIKTPKNKKELFILLRQTYKCGCNDGYGFEHTVSLLEQEELGFKRFIGEITNEEFEEKITELQGY